MAFSLDQKATIVRLLGWPGNVINPDSLSYNNIITSRFLTVLSVTETQAMALVDRIIELDEKLDTALDQSGVKQIDDIHFFSAAEGGGRIAELRKERRRLIRELSQLLDIPMMGGGSGMGSVCL